MYVSSSTTLPWRAKWWAWKSKWRLRGSAAFIPDHFGTKMVGGAIFHLRDITRHLMSDHCRRKSYAAQAPACFSARRRRGRALSADTPNFGAGRRKGESHAA